MPCIVRFLILLLIFATATFRSLLYEACGRIINPIYGSAGLLWSSNWNRCQAAVDAVLKGLPVVKVPATAVDADSDTAAAHLITPLKGCDIRHISKYSNAPQRVQTRTRFKRTGSCGRSRSQLDSIIELAAEPARFSISDWNYEDQELFPRAPSHDSSMFSGETVEPTLADPVELGRNVKPGSPVEENDVGLELSLSLNTMVRSENQAADDKTELIDLSDGDV